MGLGGTDPYKYSIFSKEPERKKMATTKKAEEEEKCLGKIQRGEVRMSGACRRAYVAFEEKYSRCQVKLRI